MSYTTQPVSATCTFYPDTNILVSRMEPILRLEREGVNVGNKAAFNTSRKRLPDIGTNGLII